MITDAIRTKTPNNSVLPPRRGIFSLNIYFMGFIIVMPLREINRYLLKL